MMERDNYDAMYLATWTAFYPFISGD